MTVALRTSKIGVVRDMKTVQMVYVEFNVLLNQILHKIILHQQTIRKTLHNKILSQYKMKIVIQC